MHTRPSSRPLPRKAARLLSAALAGQFSPCAFCDLTADQLQFVRLFIETRGNLREMEKALGVSYPTVRNKLEEIAQRLAALPSPEGGMETGPVAPPASNVERRRVLQMISEGKVSPKDGIARLRALGSGGSGTEQGQPGGGV